MQFEIDLRTTNLNLKVLFDTFRMGTNTTLVILQGLAPAYIRFGGPDTNRYIFKSQKNADSAVRTSEEYAITGTGLIVSQNSIYKYY